MQVRFDRWARRYRATLHSEAFEIDEDEYLYNFPDTPVRSYRLVNYTAALRLRDALVNALPVVEALGRNWDPPPSLSLPDEPEALAQLQYLAVALAEEERRLDAGERPYFIDRKEDQQRKEEEHVLSARAEVQHFPEGVQQMRDVVTQHAPELGLTLDGSLRSLATLDEALHQPGLRQRLDALIRTHMGREDDPTTTRASLVGIYFCEAVRLCHGGVWSFSLAFGAYLDGIGGRPFRLPVSAVRASLAGAASPWSLTAQWQAVERVLALERIPTTLADKRGQSDSMPLFEHDEAARHFVDVTARFSIFERIASATPSRSHA
ncbi:MAG: hypothetical protein AAFN13_08635 [Bacteroidota bacterium]